MILGLPKKNFLILFRNVLISMKKTQKGKGLESLNSPTTKKHRNEIIGLQKYLDETKYNDRYKKNDIKEALTKIYHSKCAYCEKKVGDTFPPIEHYRPKAIYYWLAYSWDNLLLSCVACNTYKGKHFNIEGQEAILAPQVVEDSQIHRLSLEYNKIERPKIVHPEQENVEDRLIFSASGKVDSKDQRVKYTIQACRIDRADANEERQRLYNDFRDRFKQKIYDYKKEKDKERKKLLKGALEGFIDDFEKDLKDPCKEYTAYRRWIKKQIPRLIKRFYETL